MWKTLFRHNTACSILAGLCVTLACPPIGLVPFSFLFPIFLIPITLRVPRFRHAFLQGFLCSFVIMTGVFYWVTYVIHEFGYLPWWISGLLFLGFCGFGALNFPLFVVMAGFLNKRLHLERQTAWRNGLWFTIGLPALFTFTEFLIPKLFPWWLGHMLNRLPWTFQIAEITGTTFLSFCIFSMGGALSLFVLKKTDGLRAHPAVFSVPALLWILCIGFSVMRLNEPLPESRVLEVALIQPNIGSLEKVEAERGITKRIRIVVDRYKKLTEQALKHDPKPELVVWPETAMPFSLESSNPFAIEVKDFVTATGITLITGGYGESKENRFRDYNAAYLIEAGVQPPIRGIYKKNVLLAFGEYMPLGDQFPQLYEYFPQVSNFERGNTQEPFTLLDGTRLGVTICYEAILPAFFRNTAAAGVQGVINITNDSWFGPTSEPSQHAALTVFRSVETRLPLVRTTNTGISFTVDSMGRMSQTTGVYEEGVLHSTLHLPKAPPKTFYLLFGDWFVIVCLVMVAGTAIVLFRQSHVPLPV